MGVPIIFSRTASLGAPAATLSLTGIPQTADHLLFRIRCRKDTELTNDEGLYLRVNGSSSNIYNCQASQATTGAFSTGVGGDGVLNDTELVIAELATNEGLGAVFQELWGILPDYASSDEHVIMGLGTSMDGATIADLNAHRFNGVINDANPITQLNILNEGGDNFAAGTAISVWGLADEGDVSVIARSAGTLTIDFEGDEFKDVTLAAGVNTFTFTNPVLGRNITVFLTGGDGTTSITLPGTVQKLEDNYVAGAAAVMFLRCTNETGPEYIATIKDVI